MSDFRRGDNVVLKSGGPAMTVSAVEGGKVICIRVTWSLSARNLAYDSAGLVYADTLRTSR